MLLKRLWLNLFYLFLALTIACSEEKVKQEPPIIHLEDGSFPPYISFQFIDTLDFPDPPIIDTLALRLDSMGLVNLYYVDSSIWKDIRYSQTNNFLRKDLYNQYEECYLQPEVAEKLSKAQHLLKQKDSTFSILVFDCSRPAYIQRLMWEEFSDSSLTLRSLKAKFLAHPEKHSLHNYGAAVDVTIVNHYGVPLDMGTEYDDFTELAYPSREWLYIKNGELKEEQLQNRRLLRSVMIRAGFFPIDSEWWHFNSCSRVKAKAIYPFIN